MSLGQVLSGCRRERVPANLLKQCREADAVVVDNILTVLQDAIPCTNIPLSVIRVHSAMYEITVPVSSGDISLQQLLTVQNYSPARIADIKVVRQDPVLAILLSVCDETHTVMCTDINVVRICKRSKR